MQLYNYKKGYTLLFSIIVASVVLSIAAFILSVSRKQFILSTSARDSAVAIYAADSGIQCMIEIHSQIEKYYSKNEGSASSAKFPNFPSSKMYCGNSAFNKDVDSLEVTDIDKKDNISEDMSLDSSKQIFQSQPVALGFESSCAIVTLTQGYSEADPNRRVTVIDSRGYSVIKNSPCSSSNSPLNPRVLERAIRLIYKY